MPRPADRRAKIELLRSAETVFVEHGLGEAKVEDITARAGVSKGAFYLHFESKEDCFRQIVEAFVAKLASCLDDVPPPPTDARGLGFLVSHLAEWHAHDVDIFEFCWQNRGLMGILFSGGGGASYSYLIDEFAERVAEQIQGWARHLMAIGVYRKDLDPEVLPALISGGYERLMREMIKRPKRPDVEGWARQAMGLYVRGLLTDRARAVVDREVSPDAERAVQAGVEPNGEKSATGSGTGRSRGFAGVAALVLAGGLFAVIGARVKETLVERKAQASALAEQVKAAPRRVGAAVVHGVSRSWRPSIPLSGTLSPVQEAEVGFKTGGRLVGVRVKVGDRVRAGQQLAALDVAEASAQAAATSAGVRAAQVSYEMAKDAEKRTGALFEQHAVSDAENLAVQNRAALALAQLEQARAQAQLAAVGVGNGSLGAPFSGLVTRAPSGVGKIVGPGEALFHVEDTSVLKLTGTLSEGDARLVEPGADVRVDGVSATPPVDGASSSPGWLAGGVRGRITAVLASLDPQTRRVPVYAEIPNDAASPMLAGAFVRATVVSAREVPILELPPGALRPGSQDEVVLLASGKAHLVRVAFTQGPGGALLVRGGISASDDVVLDPSSEVREGDDLSGAAPAPAGAPPAPAEKPLVTGHVGGDPQTPGPAGH